MSKIKTLFHWKFLRESGLIFETLRHGRILKLGKFELFSVNVTEKLGGYSTFPEEGNFITQKCLERPICILRPFQVEEKRWSCSHIQQWSRRYFLARYLPSNSFGKDGVRTKSQIRLFKSLIGVLTGRKNKRDIFYLQSWTKGLRNCQSISKFERYNDTSKTQPSPPLPPPSHQCCSTAEKEAGSSSDLESNIELGGGGSEGLVLSRRCFL